MAALFAPLDATPYSCTILISGNDGAAGTLPYVVPGIGTDIRRSLVDGPLKTAMDRLFAVTHLDDINLGNPSGNVIRMRFVCDSLNSEVTALDYNVHWTTTALSAQMTAASTMLLQLRFQHSDDR